MFCRAHRGVTNYSDMLTPLDKSFFYGNDTFLTRGAEEDLVSMRVFALTITLGQTATLDHSASPFEEHQKLIPSYELYKQSFTWVLFYEIRYHSA